MATHKVSLGKIKKGTSTTLIHLAETPLNVNYLHRPHYYTPSLDSYYQFLTFDKRKKEWIYFLDNNRTLSIGYINSKLASNNLLVITHWSETQQQFKFAPCTGCSTTSWLSETSLCQIQIPRSRTAILPNNNFTWNKPSNTVYANIEELCPEYIPPTISVPLPRIQIDDIVTQLIKSSFLSERTCTDLISRSTQISQEAIIKQISSLDFYTDGLLDASVNTPDGTPIMGSGWIIPSLNITFGCASTMWPSSTKAELIAIWTALLAVPQMINSVTIFTDSQASLDGIDRFKPQNIRKYSQSPNGSIIEQIIRIILIKQLSISWVKVKGHSGDTHNDTADDLAKKLLNWPKIKIVS